MKDDRSAYFVRCAGECRLLAASLPTQSDAAAQILVKIAEELEDRAASERSQADRSAHAASVNRD